MVVEVSRDAIAAAEDLSFSSNESAISYYHSDRHDTQVEGRVLLAREVDVGKLDYCKGRRNGGRLL